MTNATLRTVMIAAGIVLALGTGNVYKPAFADTGTTTFPNYSLHTTGDSGLILEMAAIGEMSEVTGPDLQATTKTHTTTTFPNYSIIEPAPSVGHASSVTRAPRELRFNPWVHTTP